MHPLDTFRKIGGPLMAWGALAVAACAVSPVTGERELVLVGEAQEIRLGREADEQIVAELGLYGDPALQAYVQRLGLRLAARSERPGLPWTFRVVDDPVVNAFALPGGFIYVTRGIMAHLNSEAELAAVLGHEIGHVTARHSVRQMTRQTVAQLGVGAATVVFPGIGRFAELAGAGLGLVFLKYGRDDERQADDLGLRYMRDADYDPRRMIGVFELLTRVSQAQGGGRIPEWLSTHPDPENRQERTAAQVAALPPEPGDTLVGGESYLARLNGLVYGQNPREGYFRGSLFLHPELRFQLDFPEGWKTLNQRQAVLGASPEEDALIQVTLSRAAVPEAAAQEFLARPGVSGSVPARATIHALPAVVLGFSEVAEGGETLGGAVAFISHGGAVYRVLAYAPRARWPAYRAAAERSVTSFRPLADPADLAVGPWRVETVRLERPMTLEEFARRYPAPVPVRTLALLNAVEPGAVLEAGRLAKRVVGEPLV